MYRAGCARYAVAADEQRYRDEMFQQLVTYLLAAIGSGIAIAILIAIFTSR